MKKYIFLLLLVLVAQLSLFSQEITISGRIIDNKTGEDLPNSLILVNRLKYVETNANGEYSFKSSTNDSLFLRAQFIGYNSKDTFIRANEDKIVNFELSLNNSIDTIFVFESLYSPQKNEISTVKLPIRQLKLLPSLSGESDIVKSIQFLPGVQSGPEGKNGMNVRGGTSGQNLVLLDNVQVFNINHIGGFLSVFNSDLIKSVEFIKGGFPARYGTKLSSILNVQLDDGNVNELHTSLSISNISASLSFSTPIHNNKTSLMMGVRYFYLDPMLKLLSYYLTGSTKLSYKFYDLNLKINHQIDENCKWSLNLFKSHDNFSNILMRGNPNSELVNIWGNEIISFQYNEKRKDISFLNYSLSYSNFNLNNNLNSYYYQPYSVYEKSFKSSISDFIYQVNYQKAITRFYELKAGNINTFHYFKPGKTAINQSNATENAKIQNSLSAINAFENAFYVENIIDFSPKLSANMGIRLNNYFSEKEYFSIEPRCIISYKTTDKLSIKASFTKTQQAVHFVPNNSLLSVNDFWLLSNKTIKPEISYQSTIGVYSDMNQKWFLSLESYYKKSNHLVAIKEGYSLISVPTNWFNLMEREGQNTSFGLEFFLQKKEGAITGWLSYTLAKSMQQFDNINQGNSYPFEYDRRHQINIVMASKIGKNVIFSWSWVFGSGYPYTKPLYNFNSALIYYSPLYVYSDKNEYRMEAYHRLDLALSFIKKKAYYTRTWQLSVYNAYNRKNPLYYEFTQNNKKPIIKHSLFPFLPSLSYSAKF